VANSEDRVAAVIATFLSCGLDRAVGIYHGNISSPSRGGAKDAVDAWSVAAALGATEWFIGQRPFERLLFPNGLPWVMVFDGVTGPEDGTVVVVGDIGGSFGHDGLPFRTVHGFREIARKPQLETELAALPETPPVTLAGKEKDAFLRHRKELQHDIHHEVLADASLTLATAGNHFALYDFYGNPVPAQHGKIVVPLDGRGFFLRGDGKAGSFARHDLAR